MKKEHKTKIADSVRKSYTKELRKLRSDQLMGNKNGKKNKGRKLSASWKKKISKATLGNQNKRGKFNPELFAINPTPNPKGRGLWIVILINSKKQKAKTRKIKWSLSDVDAAKLISGECFYCGFRGLLNEMGIDRRDNSIREYKIENCASCCKYCNSAKQDRSEKDFRAWLDRIRGFKK